MNLLEEYIAYLKDNPNHYWFKRKLYGWGWTPATWQGWTVLGAYLGFVFWLLLYIAPNTPDMHVAKAVLFPVLGATILFVTISWRKGESPKWQWGNKE